MTETEGRSWRGFTNIRYRNEIQYVSSQEQFDIFSQTLRINFREQASLADGVLAHGCVVVMTNDGEKGSLSHLTTDNNAIKFAADLREYLDKPGIPVCLAGGDERIPASLALVHLLQKHLLAVGFKLNTAVPYSDILGSFLRQSTLTATGVYVRRLPLQQDTDTEVSEVIKLEFPQ